MFGTRQSRYAVLNCPEGVLVTGSHRCAADDQTEAFPYGLEREQVVLLIPYPISQTLTDPEKRRTCQPAAIRVPCLCDDGQVLRNDAAVRLPVPAYK